LPFLALIGYPSLPMTAVALSKPEIVTRLVEIHTVRRALDAEESELLARLQRPKRDKDRPIELTFGKNIISWGNGQALPIRGKGYRFLKALYFADGMRLKEEILGRIVWGNNVLNHRNFTRYVLWLSEKLEKAHFPYRLIPAKSKEKIKTIENPNGGKPTKARVQSEIIGIKLGGK